MLAFRLIARLDVRGPHLIKTRSLEGVRKVGDPYEYAMRYDAAGIDEIFYLDVVASLYGRNALPDLVNRTRQALTIPMTVGGGICSVEDARVLMEAGADGIAVNTAAIKRPELISEIAGIFGSQAITIQIDAKGRGDSWEAYCDGGRQPTGRNAVAWAAEAVERGAGQVLVTSIDQEGRGAGCDVALGHEISIACRVPVVIAGGVGFAGHVVEAARTGAEGVAMAGYLHYGGPFTIYRAKRCAAYHGIEIRLVNPGREIRDLWDDKVREAA